LSMLPPENGRRWTVLAGKDRGVLHTSQFSDISWHTTPKEAQAGDVLRVHDFHYFSETKRRCLSLTPDNGEVDMLDVDTAVSYDSFGCALLAAGSVCEAVDIIMRKHVGLICAL